MKDSILRLVTKYLFYLVFCISIMYILSDVLGLISIDKQFGELLVWLFLIGAPLSFVFSICSMLRFGYMHYKLYVWVSSVEMLMLVLVFLVVYKSQI